MNSIIKGYTRNTKKWLFFFPLSQILLTGPLNPLKISICLPSIAQVKKRNGLSESKKKVYSTTEKEKLFSSSESYHCTICLFPLAVILTSALQKVSRDELPRFLQGPYTRVVQNLPQLPCVFSSHELIYLQFAWRSSSCIKTWFPKCVGRIQWFREAKERERMLHQQQPARTHFHLQIWF